MDLPERQVFLVPPTRSQHVTLASAVAMVMSVCVVVATTWQYVLNAAPGDVTSTSLELQCIGTYYQKLGAGQCINSAVRALI